MACSDEVRSVAGKLGYKLSPLGSVYDFAAKWMSGDTAARKKLDEILKKAGLGMEDVMAEALFERVDRMVASAEARRNNALREIDRHRSTFGAAVRQAIDEVQDAPFRDVQTGEVSGGSPA